MLCVLYSKSNVSNEIFKACQRGGALCDSMWCRKKGCCKIVAGGQSSTPRIGRCNWVDSVVCTYGGPALTVLLGCKGSALGTMGMTERRGSEGDAV